MPPSQKRPQTQALPFSRDTRPLTQAGRPTATDPVHRTTLTSELDRAEHLMAGMRPRVKVLERAIEAIACSPKGLADLFQEVSDGERDYTMQVAALLISDSPLAGRARVVVQQFEVADLAMHSAQQVYEQFVAQGIESGLIEGFSLAKFRGCIYPLANFSAAFQGVPMLEALFPPLVQTINRADLQRRPASTQPLAADETIAKLVREVPRLALLEPLLERGTSLVKQAREAIPDLKARGLDWLRRVQHGSVRMRGAGQQPGMERLEGSDSDRT